MYVSKFRGESDDAPDQEQAIDGMREIQVSELARFSQLVVACTC